jgi:hypothetical protein
LRKNNNYCGWPSRISFDFQHRSGLLVETLSSHLADTVLRLTENFFRSTAVICPGIAEEVVVEMDRIISSG